MQNYIISVSTCSPMQAMTDIPASMAFFVFTPTTSSVSPYSMPRKTVTVTILCNSISTHRKSKTNSSLRVTCKSPLESRVGKHFSAHFASEGSVSFLETTILRTHCNIFTEVRKTIGQMNSRCSNDNLPHTIDYEYL